MGGRGKPFTSFSRTKNTFGFTRPDSPSLQACVSVCVVVVVPTLAALMALVYDTTSRPIRDAFMRSTILRATY